MSQDITFGNLYEINKQAVFKEKPLTRTEYKKKLREIKNYFLLDSCKYYMLLNRERNDYTLFNLCEKNEFKIGSIMIGLGDCLTNRGDIVSIDSIDEGTAFEIWIKTDKEAFAYYLFAADDMVIE